MSELQGAMERLYAATRDERDQRITALEAEVKRLRGALAHVEWTAPPYPAMCVPFCPWCGTTAADDHRFDCMRQAALAPTGDGGRE